MPQNKKSFFIRDILDEADTVSDRVVTIGPGDKHTTSKTHHYGVPGNDQNTTLKTRHYGVPEHDQTDITDVRRITSSMSAPVSPVTSVSLSSTPPYISGSNNQLTIRPLKPSPQTALLLRPFPHPSFSLASLALSRGIPLPADPLERLRFLGSQGVNLAKAAYLTSGHYRGPGTPCGCGVRDCNKMEYQTREY